MGGIGLLAHDVLDLARDNKGWMGWNLALAIIPALLAVWLFPHRDRRSFGWWAGVAAFALLLPNAPYVVTDLVHLGSDVALVRSGRVVVAGVLPMYATFVLVGYLAYLLAIERVLTELRLDHPRIRRLPVELVIHAACSVGIVLGRVARLNSWDTVTSPTGTLERSFQALAWKGAPFALVSVFVAVTLTYTVIRVLVFALVGWVGGLLNRAATPGC